MYETPRFEEKPIVADAEPVMNLVVSIDDLLALALRIAQTRRELVASIAALAFDLYPKPTRR